MSISVFGYIVQKTLNMCETLAGNCPPKGVRLSTNVIYAHNYSRPSQDQKKQLLPEASFGLRVL